MDSNLLSVEKQDNASVEEVVGRKRGLYMSSGWVSLCWTGMTQLSVLCAATASVCVGKAPLDRTKVWAGTHSSSDTFQREEIPETPRLTINHRHFGETNSWTWKYYLGNDTMSWLTGRAAAAMKSRVSITGCVSHLFAGLGKACAIPG